ncbi:MAG: glycoside hydrolase family 5 protein [Candidatus Midichloria sp.]|nr:glycoside hydrolase family 5 protein [Candidatus Midichloria sp.]
MRLFIIIVFCFSLIIKGNAFSLSLQEKLLFWDKPQKGANIFNKVIDRQDIQAAKNVKIKFIRLAIDKFPTNKRDFLIGNADQYEGLVKEDLELLKKILDIFEEEKMPVVLTTHTLPGSRYYANNNGRDDLRIWSFEEYQRQAVAFWQDLSRELKDHPAIIGFNIINGPTPEKLFINHRNKLYELNQENVQQVLHNFYQDIIIAIRKIDKNIKIIIDSSAEGEPNTFKNLIKQNIPNIMYSFHMYEPTHFTDKRLNQNRFTYPGEINGEDWNKDRLRTYLKPVKDFQIKNKIPNTQILVGGFGCSRYASGVEHYLQDLIDIFTEFGWHTTFSYFRQYTSDDMDYELGNKKLPWSYYQALDSGFNPRPERDGDNKIFQIIKEYLTK